MKLYFYSLVSLLFSFSQSLYAQEMLFPLQENIIIKNYLNTERKTTLRPLNDTLKLPFFDDFSFSEVFPDPDLWIDNEVFINNGLGDSLISIGIATFDGMDNQGNPYSKNGTYGSADSLTSQPLDLAYQAKDSLYLSFFYQPQGKGRAPSAKDSLILEFKEPDSGAWNMVWFAKGSKVKPFHQVMIPIKDSIYLKSGFQFRFRNKAELSGNLDHWNIDYVKLNKNRHATDTILNDIAFSSLPSSILKHYEHMPFNQFSQTDLIDNSTGHFCIVRNNFNKIKSLNYSYRTVEGISGDEVSKVQRGIQLDPFAFKEELFLPYDVNYGSKKFHLQTTYTIATDSIDFSKKNDTVKKDQYFYDYYAYDDGNPEDGYGVSGLGSQLAYKFGLNNPDTITSVRMMFTKIGDDVSQELFTLTIWDQNTSTKLPGNIVYQKETQSPQYTPYLNGFYNYDIDDTILVLKDTFFVGWVQSSDKVFGVGFDRSKNNNDKTYFNVSSDGWQKSFFEGTLMIRPVFAEHQENPVGIKREKNKNHFDLFPNPAQDRIYIRLDNPDDLKNFKYEITTVLGNVIQSGSAMDQIMLNTLVPGFYSINLRNKYSGISTSKSFVKTVD